MIGLEVLWILPLSFTGFVVKGIATFGPGIVMVPVGALIFGARDMVLLSGCLDLISNISLFKPNRDLFRNPFWISISMIVAMIAGTLPGSILLSILPAYYFDLIFGALLLPLGLWILLTRSQSPPPSENQTLPTVAKPGDILLSFLSGCMSGLSGITAPILAWHFNRHYNKQAFRSIMIPLLLVSAISRVVAYSLSGILTLELLPLVLLSIPGLVLGLWLGNRLFLKISQKWFGAVIGGLVSLSGIKLLIK